MKCMCARVLLGRALLLHACRSGTWRSHCAPTGNVLGAVFTLRRGYVAVLCVLCAPAPLHLQDVTSTAHVQCAECPDVHLCPDCMVLDDAAAAEVEAAAETAAAAAEVGTGTGADALAEAGASAGSGVAVVAAVVAPSGRHSRRHAYRVVDNLGVALSPAHPAWTAEEELRALEGIAAHGFGNWA